MATAYVSIGPLKVPGILDGEISRTQGDAVALIDA